MPLTRTVARFPAESLKISLTPARSGGEWGVPMTFFSVTLLGGILGIIAIEAILWRLFRMRMIGLHFPGAAGPVSRMSALSHARVLAIIHSVVLLVCTILSLIFLW